MFDRAKTLIELKKIQSALAKETLDVEAGNNAAVKIRINGESKIQKITIDPSAVDLGDLGRLEKWLESGVNQAITRSQQLAAEKMKSVAGGLGLPGF